MNMEKLVCRECSREFGPEEGLWRCRCGGLLDVKFDSKILPEKIDRRERNLWRYREAIPVSDDAHIVSMNEGFTPLLKMSFNGKDVLVKQDYLFPTGSFKDRGSSVLISKVRELGLKRVVEDSSGNAGSSISAYSVAAGIKCEIFCPEGTPESKLNQIRSYGASLKQIKGTRDDASAAALRRAENIYYASHHWNPYFHQGMKTFAFEIAEQLNWESPDAVVVPVGSGSLFIGLYRGFRELIENNILSKMPEIIGVQAENCSPVVKAFKENRLEIMEFEKEETIAEGISIRNPVQGNEILRILDRVNGLMISVSEKEIVKSVKELCSRGIYVEVTSAAVIAGVKKYIKSSMNKEKVVTTLTSTGLKNSEKILKILKYR